MLAAPNRIDPYWGGLWSTSGASAKWVSRRLADQMRAAGLGRLPRPLAGDAKTTSAMWATKVASPAWAGSSATRRDAGDPAEPSVPATAHRTGIPAGQAGLNGRISALGVLHAWRSGTAEQIAAFTGVRRQRMAGNPDTAAMFNAGLLDLGVLSVGLKGTSGLVGRDVMMRVSPTTSTEFFEREVGNRLTWAEWIAVTGGQPWAWGGNYDRHNVLSAELGLRVAEYCEVGTVLGERFSTADLLAGTGVGLDPVLSDRRGDLTVVRPDGMRVVLEVTASTARWIRDKAEHWARLMAERPSETTGLSVIFVIAPAPESLGGSTSRDWSTHRAAVYKAILGAVRKYPGASFDQTARRFGVVTWREWFPASHRVTPDFLGLRADRPVGWDSPEAYRLAETGARMEDLAEDGTSSLVSTVWESADFLDASQVGPPPGTTLDPRLSAVIGNASLLGQTPYWLRRGYVDSGASTSASGSYATRAGAAPNLADLIVARSGLSGHGPNGDGLPVPTVARPSRGDTQRALGVLAGKKTEPPRRITGLPSPA